MWVQRQCLHVSSSPMPIPLHTVSQPGTYSPMLSSPGKAFQSKEPAPSPFLKALRAKFGPGGAAFPSSQLLLESMSLPPALLGQGELQRVKAQGRGAAAAQWADEVRVLHKVAIVQHTVAAGFCLTGSHRAPP